MKVNDGIRAWSIFLYQGKPYIILAFITLENQTSRVDFVKIAEWNYSIDINHIRDVDLKYLKKIEVRYDKIQDCNVLLSW